MAGNLNGKVAVVTGSTRGFGFAIAQALLGAGAKVIVSGRTQAGVDQAVGALRPLGTVAGFACDVSIPEEVYRLARQAVQWQGQINVWINNAGYAPAAGSVIDFPPQENLQTLLTNCQGVFNGTQAALAVMLPKKQGVLVNIYGRGSRLEASSPTGLYAASKAWITSYTRTLAAEYKGTGMLVIGFSPGMMLTEMLSVEKVVGERVRERMKNMPLVLKALAQPPARAAAELVQLLETNRKEFVEYRVMRGVRATAMISRMMWMLVNPKARPPAVDYPTVEAYRPPVDEQ